MEEDKVNEFEVWHGLAHLYSSLSHWNDVEVCLKKAGELKQYSASMLHTEGKKKKLLKKSSFAQSNLNLGMMIRSNVGRKKGV